MTEQRTWGGKREGAGRRSGSKNKRTEATETILTRLNCDPITGMALIANNDKEALGITEDVPIALRAKMYEALAPYVAPKLRASEITHHQGEEQPQLIVQVSRELADKLEAQAGASLGIHQGQ